ncbi:conserved domain protein [Megasphaera sp. UPII 135-E]|nr:conserved domain protein [Megasphaera sp. UPII 135-E]
MAKKELLSFPHIYLKEEDDFCQLVQEGSFDVIIGDIYFKRAIPHFTGVYIDYPHFAVSGRE